MHRTGRSDEDQEKITQRQLDSFKSRHPENRFEAAKKFEKWRGCDPYPQIEPSLLNCADFCDYVVETGMIFPFRLTTDDIKLATCAFRIKGDVVFWNKEGDKQSHTITDGKDFTLKGNSIAFVTLEPYLRIPDYIALRFNLKIDYIYKGLLLGTGPIIDPGYQGRLSIPLHNLTNRDYTLTGGDPLIWVEFTKLSHHPRWKHDNNNLEPDSRYPFLYDKYPAPPEESEWDVHYHLGKAVGTEGVRSSIPDAIDNAKKAATKARTEANRSSWIAIATLVATVIGLLIGLLGGLMSVNSVQRTYESEVIDLREQVHQQQRLLDKQESIIDKMRSLNRNQQSSQPNRDSEN